MDSASLGQRNTTRPGVTLKGREIQPGMIVRLPSSRGGGRVPVSRVSTAGDTVRLGEQGGAPRGEIAEWHEVGADEWVTLTGHFTVR